MPTSVVRTAADEEKWKRAKKIVADQGKGKNYALIMHIYQNMKKGLPVDTGKNPRLLLKAEQLTMFGGGGGGGKKGGGEGSRGGKVIGHTKSGKPIYEGKKTSSAVDRVWQHHHDSMTRHGEIASAFSKHKPAKTHNIVPAPVLRGGSAEAHHEGWNAHNRAMAPFRSGEHNKYVALNMGAPATKASKRASLATAQDMAALVDHHRAIAKDHADAVDRLTEMQSGGRTGLPNILRRHIANHEHARDAHKAAASRANAAMRSADIGTLSASDVTAALGHSNSAQRASVAADHEGRWAGHPGITGRAPVPNQASRGSMSPKHGARAEYHFQNAVHALAAGDDKNYGRHMDAGKAHRRAEDAIDEGNADREQQSQAAWQASKRAHRMLGGALHKSEETDMDLMKSFDAMEKAAQFTPRGGNDPKAMQPRGAKTAGPPATQQQPDAHAQQVIGHTADGQPVYGEQEVLEKIEKTGAAPEDGGAGPAGGDAAAKPSAPAPKPSAPAAGGQAAGIPMGQGADTMKGGQQPTNGANGNGANGNGANGNEGTHEHHRDKALAHLQAATKHAEAAHSAKKVDEAKEHGQVVQQAQAASHAAVSGTSPPATGIGGAAGAGGPMPQGQPGQPPQIGKPAGGKDGVPADGVPPPGDDGVTSNGPGGDDEDDDGGKKGKPFGKSEWLARYRPELRDGVDDLHKSLGLMYDRDVTSWAGQFAGSPLYAQALTLLKKQLETGRKHELERKAMPTWSEIDEMPKSKRDLVRKKQNDVFDRHQKERQAMDIERDQLEMKLIDHKIAQAAKMREAAMTKARHQEEDTLRKSDPAPAAPPAQATVLRKGRMEIRVDGGDEDQILKAIEDGTTVIGAQGAALPQDGRHLLLGRRGTRLEKSGGIAGGTIYQGEHDAQGSRGGDYRESYARAQEFVNIQDDDPAGNRGQGGLAQWFSDAWSPHDPTQRVPANVGTKAAGWQKSSGDPDAVRVIDDGTPYGRASMQRPQEHASSARMLAQGGRRDMVGGRR